MIYSKIGNNLRNDIISEQEVEISAYPNDIDMNHIDLKFLLKKNL